MIITMSPAATTEETKRVLDAVASIGLKPYLLRGKNQILIDVAEDTGKLSPENLSALPGVEKVVRTSHPFKLASRDFHPAATVVNVAGITIGGKEVVIMAGPCAVEDEMTLLTAAYQVKQAGATILRGGAFKPRTSPYSFQGLGIEGLKLLAKARKVTGLPVVTEVVSPETVEVVAEYADILQIGSRNMQNFALLQEVGRVNKPVLLKRGLMSSVEEWLLAAEYILTKGNNQVILCERGIRTFERYTRNTLDLSAVPLAKQLSHLPVIVDPSHGTGQRNLIAPMACAAIAAGADGLMIEVHPNPANALSDGSQSLTPQGFAALMQKLESIAASMGRRITSNHDQTASVHR